MRLNRGVLLLLPLILMTGACDKIEDLWTKKEAKKEAETGTLHSVQVCINKVKSDLVRLELVRTACALKKSRVAESWEYNHLTDSTLRDENFANKTATIVIVNSSDEFVVTGVATDIITEDRKRWSGIFETSWIVPGHYAHLNFKLIQDTVRPVTDQDTVGWNFLRVTVVDIAK